MSSSEALIACIVVLSSRLDHAVELEGLSRRDAQGAVGIAAGDLVELQPLRGLTTPPGRRGADHEAVGRLEFLLATLVAQVAIVLLVATVELDQDRVVVADCAGVRVVQALDQGATQVAADRA